MNSKLLQEYVRRVLESSSTYRKLRVFDFDDTIVKTGSKIYVTSAAGEKFTLTPGEYAVYEPAPGDQFDYSDFSKLVDPQAVKWTLEILRRVVSTGGDVVVLTARAVEDPVHQFLEEVGLPPIEVVALADADPLKKSDYIARRIEEDGYDFIEFFDDSYKNVAAVKALQPLYPDVKIVPRHIVHRTHIS